MTLLTIATDAADELQVTRPGSVAGSTADTSRRMLRYANAVGRDLMKEYAWQDLRREQTFTAIAGEVQTGILPSDFDRFVPETFWDRSSDQFLSGPIPAARWQGLKARNYSNSYRKFMIRNDSVYAIPAFGGGESLAFEYVTNQWCQSSGGTGQAAFAADTDTARIDEELITRGIIYKWLLSEGLPFEGALNAFVTYKNDLIKNDEPRPRILVAGDIFARPTGRHWTGTPEVNVDLDVLDG